jgi:N utilization substance protein A
MINGIVKRIDRGAIIIELGDTEGIIPRNHQVRHERYTQGDRIRAVVVDVTMDASRPQVVMSRTDPKLLEKLLEMEVPEIYDGTVIIKLCVREPGERAKVAVFRPRIATWIRWARASASRAPASRPSPASSRARRSTSSRGTPTW